MIFESVYNAHKTYIAERWVMEMMKREKNKKQHARDDLGVRSI